jgi:putative transcriptional regulator
MQQGRKKRLFDRLKFSLEEGIRGANGEVKLRTTAVPSAPPEFRSPDILRLRKRCKMSQHVFAQTLNVSLKTVQGWEEGSSKPSRAALRLLQILHGNPEVVWKVISGGRA